MTDDKIYTAALVIIGNEILSGRTQDANLAFLGTRLNEKGIQIHETRIVRDIEAEIVDAVNALRTGHDYVFTTGGIGPTHDDITSESIAKAFGLEYGRNPEAEKILLAHYDEGEVTEARMRMANTPVGATLLDNPISRAPGFQVENVFVLPGVPVIAKAIFEGFVDRLAGGKPVLSKTIYAFIPEGEIGDGLSRLQDHHPDVEIGSYPFIRNKKMGASLVLRSRIAEANEAAARDLENLIRDFGGEPVEES